MAGQGLLRLLALQQGACHFLEPRRFQGDERQRPQSLDGRQADARGEEAVQHAFAELRREPRGDAVPEELLHARARKPMKPGLAP